MLRYCKQCVLPSSRPNIKFNAEGICNFAPAKEKANISWNAREKDFKELVALTNKKSSGYDCVIPVSGGKDSTWQVITCLKYGLKPLAVTWRTPGRTKIGQENLDNMIQLGVDHLDYQISPEVEKKFMLKSFERFGTTALPMHMAIHSIPLRIAASFKIPLVVWGENSAFEYGGEEDVRQGFLLDQKWRDRYGLTHGTTAKDWIDRDLSAKDLAAYFLPTEKELENVRAIFLGYYFKWDPQMTAEVAKEHGFKSAKGGPKTGLYDYADIDCDFISVHHFMKWYKFGFTRLFDNLSIEVKNQRMTREQAVDFIRKTGLQIPRSDISKICQFMKISEDRFYEIAETFRNKEIWTKVDNVWKIPDFLIPDWDWSVSR